MGGMIDPIALAQALIRRPSVTPRDEGVLQVLADALKPLGFSCEFLTFEEAGAEPVTNLWARRGKPGASFCYAGHTDVVPVGDAKAWSVDPFAGVVKDGWLIGRGAADMKGSISAWVAALDVFLASHPGFDEPLSLLITGDEEAAAINGTVKVLGWLEERGEKLSACLVGEPTSDKVLGDMAKVGRRGSLNGELLVQGVQGHTAYPNLADNAAHRLVKMLGAIAEEPLDHGSEFFPPSNLQITSIDIGNPATNVIPAKASARFNVRFNDRYSGKTLEAWLRERLSRIGGNWDLRIKVSGESFLTPPGQLSQDVSAAVAEVTGVAPALTTTGGTSDARFIKNFCPVIELGLRNDTAHKVDERVEVADVMCLTEIYRRFLARRFPK